MKYYQRGNARIDQHSSAVENYLKHIDSAISINELMGYEANARNEYYKMFDIIMNMITPRRTAQLVRLLR
jgi:CRISPR/Cas system-associated endonuclease Cas1